MRLVIVESPYAGDTPEAVQENVDYGRRCLADALSRGEAPFASHLLYTQPGVLDDNNPGQRAVGIAAGLCWGDASGAVGGITAVYYDRGLSKGMKHGIRDAMRAGRPIELRSMEGRGSVRAQPDVENRTRYRVVASTGSCWPSFAQEPESFLRRLDRWVCDALATPASPTGRIPEIKRVAEHVDDVAVNRFAAQMKDRMARNRAEGRAGWHDTALCCAEFLSLKLWGSLYRGELIDAANYLMMLHQRGDKLVCPPQESAQ